MQRPKKLNKGDKVAIVSLSKGILGESFAKHELDLGIKRLKEFGLEPVFMPNALKSMEYLESHPEKRASDLKQAFMDKDIKAIICAIGGDDTYKTIPYLMDDKEFVQAVKDNPKIFMGFSDTTNNHLMLNKLGLGTFYGPAFLPDLAELDKEMLPYTKSYFEKLFSDGAGFEIAPSETWYHERKDFGPDELNKPRKSEKEKHGFEVLNGKGKVAGKLYGGCIESLYDAYTGERHGDDHKVFEKYHIFPTIEEWRDKILFIETCEETTPPEKLEKIMQLFKDLKILESVKGIIIGKPMDEIYYEEYKDVHRKIFKDLDTPVMYNINFGHATPRCILPYGAETAIDFDNKKIFVNSPIFESDWMWTKNLSNCLN